MAIKGAEYAVSRIITTLQTSLPAELDLIDTEMGDGLTLEDVDNAAYYEFEADASLVEHTRAIIVTVDGSDSLGYDTITNSPGRMKAEHSVTVTFHFKDALNEEPHLTKRRVLRYARAIERVLMIKYPTLPSGGVETVTRTYRDGTATYRLNEQQAEGQFVRSAVIPFKVVTHESL